MELLVGVVVASVLMAVAVPDFLAWLPTLRLSSAARQVATDLQVARMRGIAQNTSYTVTFNVASSTYSYSGDSRDLGALYPGVTIQSASANPVFTSRGTASNCTPCTITLTNSSAQKQVIINAVGRVIVQ